MAFIGVKLLVLIAVMYQCFCLPHVIVCSILHLNTPYRMSTRQRLVPSLQHGFPSEFRNENPNSRLSFISSLPHTQNNPTIVTPGNFGARKKLPEVKTKYLLSFVNPETNVERYTKPGLSKFRPTFFLPSRLRNHQLRKARPNVFVKPSHFHYSPHSFRNIPQNIYVPQNKRHFQKASTTLPHLLPFHHQRERIQTFIFTIPLLMCSEGERRDHTGSCREIFEQNFNPPFNIHLTDSIFQNEKKTHIEQVLEKIKPVIEEPKESEGDVTTVNSQDDQTSDVEIEEDTATSAPSTAED